MRRMTNAEFVGSFTYEFLEFHQFGSSTDSDRLVLLAPPAKQIAAWAGIPRKVPRTRLNYQRWLTKARLGQVTNYWELASQEPYILGPTALVVAFQSVPEVNGDGLLAIDYYLPYSSQDSPADQLGKTAETVLKSMFSRLSADELEYLEMLRKDKSFDRAAFDVHYVLQSIAEIQAMSIDPAGYITGNGIDGEETQEIIAGLEALCRPALVVDGQHRLVGASNSALQREIRLPVVALLNAPFKEQIYQFVVINETAQKIKSDLLTDIFGSSLTYSEQQEIRDKLAVSGANVDQRIAAVIADRDDESPFFGMVKITVGGNPSSGFIPELTIRQLIDGGSGAHGWRSNNAFYDDYVSERFPNREDWDDPNNGAWRSYWYAFWSEVGDFYNAQYAKGKSVGEWDSLWSESAQTNLTKAVTLRLLQRLFMEKAAEHMRKARDRFEGETTALDSIVETLANNPEAMEALTAKIDEFKRIREEATMPDSTEEFRNFVRTWFLEKGVPVRFFTNKWIPSLDDDAGRDALYEEMTRAFEATQEGKRYRVGNYRVFAASSE